MKLSDFDYDLPEELIAQTPLEDRSASRLLHLDRASGQISHRKFRDVTSLLAKDDLLVVNSTRVSALRLFGHRPTGGQVEALLLREIEPSVFRALMRPAKKLTPGTKMAFAERLEAEVIAVEEEGQRTIRFTSPGWEDTLRQVGQTPLPPYISAALQDPERYQTVYAREQGSAAAPTAGLHFTDEIIKQLKEQGINVATVTLHVSLDTFRPVLVDDLRDHVMHGEECEVPAETAQAISEAKGRIIAVGTTTVRTLESFAIGPRQVKPGRMTSKLFISPGFEFQVVDGMFTNFHLPRTTMLLMISAMAGSDAIRLAYSEAITSRYRFLSFGDSMLIL